MAPCCKTPERHTAGITLSPPPPPRPVKNCIKISKSDKESKIIPSFLPCSLSLLLTGSRFDAAMVASSSDTSQHTSRSAKRIRLAIKPTLKRRSAYFESTSQNEEFWKLEDIVKSLPPPPLGRPPRRVSISTLKSDTSSSNLLLQSQQEELLVQKNSINTNIA